MKPIWIVDDDQSIRFVLEKALTREDLPVRVFTNPRDVLAALDDDEPQVLVSDIRMPGGSGIDLLTKVKARLPGLPVIIMTAYSDLDSAVSAFQGGAFEYLPKPFDLPKAVELIRRAVDESVREEVIDERVTQMPEMLGQAPAMQDVFRAIGRLSQSNVTVMITGESGSGKELVARALHKHSPRGNGPFVAINTAAIPKDLLESELFGHERGAFTGAQTMRRGRFEQADGGTLFLDEIGDMPFDLQTRLLRVLSDGQFYRVGGHHPLKSNVRVIAATHQNLEERVRHGVFREDLFHRLNVIRLRLPALRERCEDIPTLTRFFLQKSAKDLGVEAKRISEAALAKLAAFDFPGNVRQLENICHWLTVMAPAQVIESKDLPPELLDARGSGSPSLTSSDSGAAPVGLAPAETAAPMVERRAEASARPVADAWVGSVPSEALAAPSAQVATPASVGVALPATDSSTPAAPTWLKDLERDARARLEAGQTDVWDALTRQFEASLIHTALDLTRGRRIEAAQKLGIGRNTITRKIQELGIDD
jgi:two-component system nitrogen regulation response regulator GlnG